MADSITLSGASSVAVGSSINITAMGEFGATYTYYRLYARTSNSKASISPEYKTGYASKDEFLTTFSVTGTSAGSETVYVYIQGSTNNLNWTDVTYATKSITVSAPSQKASWTTEPSAASGLVYDGSNKQLFASGGTASHGSGRYSLNGSTYYSNYMSVVASGGGTYTLYYYVAGDSGYQDSDVSTTTVTISPKSISLPNTTTESFVWDGTTKYATVSTYSEGVNRTGTTSAVAVGSYTVTYALTNTSNYKWSNNTTSNKTKSWSITSPEVTISPTSLTTDADGTTHSFTLTMSCSKGTITSSGQASASCTGALVSATASGRYVTLTFRTSDIGTYSVSLSVSDVVIDNSGITTSATFSGTITVTANKRASWSAEPTTSSGLEYTGSLQSLFADGGTPLHGIGKYSLDGVTYLNNYALVGATNAGTYTVYYYVHATESGYVDSTVKTKQVTISKQRVFVPLPITASETWVWDGNVHTPSYTPATTGMSVTGDTSGHTDVGNYTITYSLTTDQNYEYVWAQSGYPTADKTKDWSITAPPITFTPTTFSNIAADGVAHSLVVTIGCEKGSITGMGTPTVSSSPSGATVTASGGTQTITISLTTSTSQTYTLSLTANNVVIDNSGVTTVVTGATTITVNVIPYITGYPKFNSNPITFDESYHTLLQHGGLASGGTFKYCSIVSNSQPTTPSYPGSGITWTTDPFDLEGYNAGKYWVYYCVLYSDGSTVYVSPTLVTGDYFLIEGKNQTWTYTLSPASIDVYDSATLTISSGSEFSSIQVTSDFADVSITQSGLVFTITADETSGTTTISIDTVGIQNYKDRHVEVQLVISDIGWKIGLIRVYHDTNGWMTATPYVCQGNGVWVPVTRTYIHK